MVLLMIIVGTWSIKLSWNRKSIMFSITFNLLNSNKANVVALPTIMEAIIPFCWRAESLFLLGGQMYYLKPMQILRKQGFIMFQSLLQNWACIFPPKQMGFESESSVSVDRTCGSSPWLFLRREVICVWELKTQVTLDSNKYEPYNNEPLSACRSTGSQNGILAILFSVALLSCWVWGKEIVSMLLAFSIRHPSQEPKAEIQKTALPLSLSLSVSVLTTRSIHKQTGIGNWIMTLSHEIILFFPISTQGNLYSAVPFSHTTRLPLSGFSFLSLVEGNYSKCETGKRITVCSCSLFNNSIQDAIIL